MSIDGKAKLVEILRSPRKEEMYLYVEKAIGTARVPETLMKQFGDGKPVMTLLLEPSRKLARVDAQDVLTGIEEQGFYLQMPPTPEQLRRREVCRD